MVDKFKLFSESFCTGKTPARVLRNHVSLPGLFYFRSYSSQFLATCTRTQGSLRILLRLSSGGSSSAYRSPHHGNVSVSWHMCSAFKGKDKLAISFSSSCPTELQLFTTKLSNISVFLNVYLWTPELYIRRCLLGWYYTDLINSE